VGVYDSRGNYSPTPRPCNLPPPKPVPAKPTVYSWENPPPRILIQPEPEERCLVGVRFCWSNGEYLAGCNWALTQGNGKVILGTLDSKSFLSQVIGSYKHRVQLAPQFNAEKQVDALRFEIRTVLDQIVAAEREQANALAATQADRGVLSNTFYAGVALGDGFLYGAWGLAKSMTALGELANPYDELSTALVSAWNAKASPDRGWVGAFLDEYDAAQHRKLAQALGFDPSAISRERLAKAYEVASYVFEDAESRLMLARFAKDYVAIQNHESILFFTGGMVFEIVFAALLGTLTGGAGLVAQSTAASARLSPLVVKLGEKLQKLGDNLKTATVHRAGIVEGNGGGSKTVELPRPKGAGRARVSKPPTAGVLRNADRAIISPAKLTEYALNPEHSVGGPKARVFESALGFTKNNADDLLEQLRQGVRSTGSTPGHINEHGPRFTVDILVKGPKGEGIVRTGWIYDPGSDVPRLVTMIVR
jgi:hypothetical protein